MQGGTFGLSNSPSGARSRHKARLHSGRTLRIRHSVRLWAPHAPARVRVLRRPPSCLALTLVFTPVLVASLSSLVFSRIWRVFMSLSLRSCLCGVCAFDTDTTDRMHMRRTVSGMHMPYRYPQCAMRHLENHQQLSVGDIHAIIMRARVGENRDRAVGISVITFWAIGVAELMRGPELFHHTGFRLHKIRQEHDRPQDIPRQLDTLR
ncbi:hypothetical protein DFH07DRAFT_388393 [Mycena maculata]|uniref:Uncharacterized protein n=1 Tax=Mycena maculata TaxID=230809 RepID=A0AAD7NZU7_9AGAR|nr:hypothetical protein DFH07DRAFT_388393 [Mycena maculata]